MKRKELEAKVAGLQKRGIDIAVHWAYGQPRCTTMDEGRDISPRLPIGQMRWWLDGFYEGLEAEHTHLIEQNRIVQS